MMMIMMMMMMTIGEPRSDVVRCSSANDSTRSLSAKAQSPSHTFPRRRLAKLLQTC